MSISGGRRCDRQRFAHLLDGILVSVPRLHGVPVAFALIASVLVVTMFTPISLASMMAQLFNGMDTEALLAVPFFLLVGDLMTSANITVRMIALSQTLVGICAAAWPRW